MVMDCGSTGEFYDMGQPSHPSANQCVAVREQDNAWMKEQCYSLKPSVCQIDPNTTPFPSPAPTCDNTCTANVVCSPEYTFYIEICKCYKVFGSMVSFTNAQAICAQENGVLPKIPDNSTNDFLCTLVNNQYDWVWTGLNCSNGRENCQLQDGTPLGSFRPFASSDLYLNYYLVTEAIYGTFKERQTSGPSDSNYIVCQKDPTTTTALLEAMELQKIFNAGQRHLKNSKISQITSKETINLMRPFHFLVHTSCIRML